MLNFSLFIFASYFLGKVLKMIFPNRQFVRRGIVIAQYCGKDANKRKTPRKPKKPEVLCGGINNSKQNKLLRKCA